MLNYKKFYREHGLRFVRDLLTPFVWNSEALTYPKQSMLFWFNGSLTKEYPSREYGYFKNLNSPRVFTITEYADEATLGSPKYIKVNENSVIKKAKTAEPSFKYLKLGKSVTVPIASEILINLGVVNNGYHYAPHPLTPYYIWHNALTTTVKQMTIKKTGMSRHKFLLFNIPNNIPPRETINRFLGQPSRVMLNSFMDYTYFNMLELFRFISSEYKQYSILATQLQTTEFNYIDLILTVNNKSVIINLGLLASITDAYDIESKLKKFPATSVNKIMYIFLHRILEAAAISSTKDIVVNLAGISPENGSSDYEDTAPETVNLDSVIENELPVGETLEVPSEDITDEVDQSVRNIKSTDVITDATTVDDLNNDPHVGDNQALVRTIQELSSNKLMTKTVSTGLIETLADQATKKSPYNDGTKLADMLVRNQEDIILSTDETVVQDTPSALDKTANKNTISAISKRYRDKSMRKDILSTFYSIQKAGIVIKDHEITTTDNVLGKTEEHKLTIQTLSGGKSTIRVILPVIAEDNTFKLSGQKYVGRIQRSDIPLKKISNNIVSLNSYYGKLFISRSAYKKDDLGYWFYNMLLATHDTDPRLSGIAAMSALVPDAVVPKHYGLISRYIKEFTFNGMIFNFNYNGRDKLIADIDLTKVEKNGTLVGAKGSVPIIMGNDNILQLVDKNRTSLGTVFELLELDMSKAPIEYCTAKIYKKNIPIAVLLSYYVGFTKLLKLLNITYEVIETGKRYQLSDNQYRIIFKDSTYIVTKDNGVGDLILGGFKSLTASTKRIPMVLDSKSTFVALFSAMELPSLYINEIKLLENMFIDSITKDLLVLYGYPTSFRGILVKAVEMLEDDNYKHPNNIDGAVLKGYERISGMLYLELVKAIRLDANKSNFGKSTIVVNPYSVLNKVNEDSTTVLVDDINPVANIKQHEDVTYLGSHGRKEETMNEATRAMHSSEIGIISEATKDSGAVGISSYLSAAPNIVNTRGNVGHIDKVTSWAEVLSTPAMLSPFITKDSPNRANFSSIQASHIVPMKNMRAPYVMTGYEAIFSTRVSSKFVITAIDDGSVSSVSDKSITVVYKTAGRKTYKLKAWTTKEEAGASYTHKQVPNVKKGDKFKKDTALAYDRDFFEPSIFDNSRVIYKAGDSMTIALLETPEAYEDSGAISATMAKSMATTVTNVKSIKVTNTDTILKPLLVGAKVNPKDPLLSIADKTLSDVSDLDSKAIEILRNLKLLTPSSAYMGVISKIRVYYNSEFSDLSRTLKKLAEVSDAELIDELGSTGQVDKSYSIQGLPLLDGEVEIKYYIDVKVAMGVGDKGIFANQLKYTVGDVYKEPIISEDGTEIDGLFSTQSIEARIVNSPGLMGTTAKLLETVTNKVVDTYFS